MEIVESSHKGIISAENWKDKNNDQAANAISNQTQKLNLDQWEIAELDQEMQEEDLQNHNSK